MKLGDNCEKERLLISFSLFPNDILRYILWHKKNNSNNKSSIRRLFWPCQTSLTHLCRVDSSTTTLWTCLFPLLGCLVSFYYHYVLEKFLYLMQTVQTLPSCCILWHLIWVSTVCQLHFWGFPIKMGKLLSCWTQICSAFANSADPDQKPTDLDLHCLPLSMWIYINNLDQVIWLAEK